MCVVDSYRRESLSFEYGSQPIDEYPLPGGAAVRVWLSPPNRGTSSPNSL